MNEPSLSNADPKPSLPLVLQYSVMALPLAFAGLPLYIHAPDFYTRHLGLNIGLIGIILMAIRLFDAVQDPIIGYLSDQKAHKRYLIMMIGIIMLLLGMVAVFFGPQWSVSTVIWFTLSMIFATTGFSIIAINLNMIGGFLYDDKQSRTTVSAWREGFGLVGLLIASVLPAYFLMTKPASDAFEMVALIFAGILILSAIFFVKFLNKLSPDHSIYQSKTTQNIFFFSILWGKDKVFFLVCFLTHFAAAVPAVMVLFFISDYLQLENLSGLFLLLYFLSGALLMPVWVKIASKIGKEKAWMYSMGLAIATFMWAYFLSSGDALQYAVICILSGMALGADLALPPSIIADRITHQHKQSEATQFYAILAFIPKMAVALASGIVFLTLDFIGFQAGKNNDSEVLKNVIVLYAILPCLIKLASVVALKYMIKKEGI